MQSFEIKNILVGKEGLGGNTGKLHFRLFILDETQYFMFTKLNQKVGFISPAMHQRNILFDLH